MKKNILCELSQFQIEMPRNERQQEELAIWMAKSQARKVAVSKGLPADNESTQQIYIKRFMRYSVDPKRISKRAFENLDIGNENWDELELTSDKGAVGLEKKSYYFLKRANEVFSNIYKEQSHAPNHMIHVSCTGYVSPSPAQTVVNEKNWQGKTDVTHAYHMGCYAAIPAVRMASAFIAQELMLGSDERRADYKVDIVHTEMCGLHQNPEVTTPEQMIIHTLFADGHVKYSLTSPSEKRSQSDKSFLLFKTKEKLIANSTEQMTWTPVDWGFRMGLGREVPDLIAENLKSFLEELLEKSGMNWEEAQKNAIFAVHPGGPRIIDLVQEQLGLSEEQVQMSKKILFERGNMSSATLPHIWNEIYEHQYQSGRPMISLAFGPGLSIFGALFEMK